MKIETIQIEIPKIQNITSSYIENNLKEKGYKVLRWAIVGYSDTHYAINVSHICSTEQN